MKYKDYRNIDDSEDAYLAEVLRQRLLEFTNWQVDIDAVYLFNWIRDYKESRV